MQKFLNVIFDLDGLICDTEPLHMRAFNLLLEAVGAEYQFQVEEYGRILTGRAIIENAEYIRERFAIAADAEDLAQAQRSIFNVLVSDAANIDPMPGLDHLLGFLSGQRIKMGVASSSRPEHVEKILRSLNLVSTFQVVVSGDDDAKPKPDPDIYLRTLQRLNADPASTVALEDSLSGVRAARSANIFVIAVANEYTRSQDLSEANLIAASLYEVKEYMAREG